MTNEITVEFHTQTHSEIPRIGQRKSVRVNGRSETKHVKSIKVTAHREYAEGLWFVGEYTLVDASRMW